MANEKTYVIRLTKDGGSGAYEEIVIRHKVIYLLKRGK